MANRAALAERSMERFVDQVGDITRPVLDIYYARHPGTRESFVVQGMGDTAELEGRMVNAAAFMLLQWAEDPFSTQIAQGTTISHHHDTLLVGPQWYLGLFDAVLDVLLPTIPADAEDEREMWLEIRAEIAAFIDSVRPEFWRKDEDGTLPPYRESFAKIVLE